MVGDYEIPGKIAALNVSDSVKSCLAELWTHEIAGYAPAYKQLYLTLIDKYKEEASDETSNA